MPDDCGYTGNPKKNIEIALSRTVPEINAFLHFMQNLKMAKVADDSMDILDIKNFVKIAQSRTISKINAFYAEFQDGCQKWRENNFFFFFFFYSIFQYIK